jgi:WD40 repeat protein
MWNIESGKVLRQLSVRGKAMTCLGLTPDGSRALFGRYDGTVWLYDVANWKELNRFQTDWGIWSVAFSSDGHQMLTAAGHDTNHPVPGYGDRGPVRIWNLETGKEERRFDGHSAGVWRAVFAPNGKQIFSAGGDHTIRIWDVAATAEVGRLRHTQVVSSIALLSDGKHALSGGWDKTVRFWDVEKRKELHRFEGHSDGVQSVNLSLDEKYAVSGGVDGTVRVWRLPEVEIQDPPAAGEIRRFLGHKGAIRSVAFTPSGRHVLSGGEDGTVRVWNVVTGKDEQHFEGHVGWVLAITVDPKGIWALSTEGQPGQEEVAGQWQVSKWEIETGRELQHFSVNGASMTCLALDPEGRRALFGCFDGTVWLYDVENWRELDRFQTNRGLWSVAFSPNGRQLLTAGGFESRGHLRLWNLETGEEQKQFDGHRSGIARAIFMPDGEQIVSASNDRTIRIWDVATAKEQGRLRHMKDATSIALSRDGKHAVSGGTDNVLRYWDVDKRKELQVFKGHTDIVVQAVSLSHDEKYAVSGSYDGTVRVWRLPDVEKQFREAP